MIDLRCVTKTYGDKTILDKIDLHVPAGETATLIGPSGCGKSTLLRLIIALIEPTSGTVLIGEDDLTAARGKQLRKLRRRIGYVIQDGGLFPHLTAGENVTLLARLEGMPREEMDARVAQLIELTKFPADGLGRYPIELSGGQRQRVALMRALMLEPEVLLLDEPLGALDPMIRFDLQNDLREICRSLGKTVVMVTHDLAEAAFFGDSIVLLHQGRIAQRGTLREMIDTPASEFVGKFVTAQRGHVLEE